MARTALYRFYDANDVLLYVGITEDVATRWDTHARDKRWWPEVARKTVEWHEDRDTAAASEITAIVDEFPLYNVVHTPAAHGPRRNPDGPPPAAPLYAAVVARLREKGMSKTDLHRQTGVARSTIDKWKTAPLAPQASTVLTVAEAVGLDLTEALRLAGLVEAGMAVEREGLVDLSQVPTVALLAELRRRIPD